MSNRQNELEYLALFVARQDELLEFVETTFNREDLPEELIDEYGAPNNDERQPANWTTGFIGWGGCKAFKDRLEALNQVYSALGVTVRPTFLAMDAMTGKGCWYNSSC